MKEPTAGLELEIAYNNISSALFGTSSDFEDKYLDCCSNVFTLQQCLMQVVFPTRYYARQLFQSGKVGTVSSVSLPPGVSVSLTKRSILATRHSVGGVRMPAVPTTFTAAGEITATGRTAYGVFCDKLNDDLEPDFGVIFEPVIFRRAQPALSERLAFAFPQDTVRTMSRRVVRRGE
jgi:hypothetical protein